MATAERCFHCQLPLADGASPRQTVSGDIGGTTEWFCCRGCFAVAQLIHGAGLGQYYRFREIDAADSKPVEEGAADFSLYNQPDMHRDFVSVNADGSADVHLVIEGIHCAACTWLIENFLQRQAGVISASVNSLSHRCLVRFRSAENAVGDLMAAIQRLGYHPHPATHDWAGESLARENRQALRRLAVAGFAMVQVGMLAAALYTGAFEDISGAWGNLFRWLSLLIATPVIVYSAQPFFRGAWRAVTLRRLTMDVPVALALALAFAASVWATLQQSGDVYFDSVTMFTFLLLLGRYLEMRARHKNLLSIHQLLGNLPRTVARMAPDGTVASIPIEQLQPGDQVLVAEGETIPADGTVARGEAFVNEALLTGEATPVWKRAGDTVIAGSLCENNSLTLTVEQLGENTRLSAVQRAMEKALQEKSVQLQRTDRLAAYFVGAVLFIAAMTAIFWWQYAPERALWVVLSVLVITCPCALSLATPVALTAAVHRLRQLGLLITRAHVPAELVKVNTVVFDKTGTLTDGKFHLERTETFGGLSGDDARAVAAALERGARHPLAAAFSDFDRGVAVKQAETVWGQGVTGIVDDKQYFLGARSFVEEQCKQFNARASDDGRVSQLWLADADSVLARFDLVDHVRAEAKAVIDNLAALGKTPILLSGDSEPRVAAVAETLGINEFLSRQTPDTKLDYLRHRQGRGETVLMVGDGLNDLPVLAGADVSMAMASATDFTRVHADSVLLGDNLRVISTALHCARFCRRVIRQNWLWALGYNALALPFAVAGVVPPWLAALGMSASSLIVVLNGLRVSRYREPRAPAPDLSWQVSTS